jgi:tRNA1Val (adenine37-N6)-methyltransferase
VQEEVARLCEKNIKLNHLENKFEVVNINVKNVDTKFKKGEIDVVVTNPPYKKEKTGLTSDDTVNLISRHEIECNLEDVIEKSSYLLKDLGQFYMVHRAERLVDIMCLLRKYRLEPKLVRFVHSKPGEKPNLILVKAVKFAKEYLKIEDPLYIYNEDGKDYTDEIYRIYEKKKEK